MHENEEWPIIMRGELVAVRSADGTWTIVAPDRALTAGHEKNSEAWFATERLLNGHA